MRGFYTLKRIRILGAKLHLHWSIALGSAFLFTGFKDKPLQAVVAICCYYGIIFLHECGHAFFAKKLGYPPRNIYLTAIHGLCEYEHPYYQKEDSVIAWGGVLAQLAVALPLVLLGYFVPTPINPYLGVAIAFFGFYSLVIAALNLLPVRGLDGGLAWRLIPILFREARHRHSAKKRAAAAIIRRVK